MNKKATEVMHLMGENHARVYESMRTALAQYDTCVANGWQAVHIMPQLDIISARIAGLPESDRRIRLRG